MPSDVVVGFVLAVFTAALCCLNCYLEDLESHGSQAVEGGVVVISSPTVVIGRPSTV